MSENARIAHAILICMRCTHARWPRVCAKVRRHELRSYLVKFPFFLYRLHSSEFHRFVSISYFVVRLCNSLYVWSHVYVESLCFIYINLIECGCGWASAAWRTASIGWYELPATAATILRSSNHPKEPTRPDDGHFFLQMNIFSSMSNVTLNFLSISCVIGLDKRQPHCTMLGMLGETKQHEKTGGEKEEKRKEWFDSFRAVATRRITQYQCVTVYQ